MKINAENILFHECVGLTTRIGESTEKSMEGIEGKILDETKNTFHIQLSRHKRIVVPKSIATFHFYLGSKVAVEGYKLVGNSGYRISKLR